jgi:hypothetical protein
VVGNESDGDFSSVVIGKFVAYGLALADLHRLRVFAEARKAGRGAKTAPR